MAEGGALATVRLSVAELAEVVDRAVLGIVASGESDPSGYVLVRAAGAGVWWFTGDERRAAAVKRGTHVGLDEITAGVLVAPSLLDFGRRAAERLDVEHVELRVGAADVTLVVPGLAVPRPRPNWERPPLEHLRPLDGPLRSATVAAHDLVAAVHAVTTFGRTEGIEGKIGLLGIGDGGLVVWTGSDHGPDRFAHVAGQRNRTFAVAVDGPALLALTEALADAQLEVRVGEDVVQLCTDDDFVASLVVERPSTQLVVPLIAELVCCGDDDVEIDGDGDVELPSSGTPIYARVTPGIDILGRDATLNIYAFAAEGIRESIGLYRELNELNDRGSRQAWFVWGGGTIRVEAHLDLRTLQLESIRSVCREIERHLQQLAPLLAAVHSGHEVAPDPVEPDEFEEPELFPARCPSLQRDPPRDERRPA